MRSAMVIGLLLSSVIVALPSAIAADDQALFKRVVTVYTANRMAIRTVEYSYNMILNGQDRECRYLSDGKRYYQAAIIHGPGGGLAMPMEVAWDGKRVYDRARLFYMAQSSNPERARHICPRPDESVDSFVEQAIGTRPHAHVSYEFRSAREVEHSGKRCIELVFDAPWMDGVLTVYHARDFGYWPVGARAVKRDGTVTYELSDVEFAEYMSEGNRLFFPVCLTQKTGPGGPQFNTIVFQVDRKSLKINEPIPDSKFVLAPWPNEMVGDLDTGEVQKPVDPKWVPDSRVGFPFDVFIRALEAGGSLGTNPRAAEQAQPPTGAQSAVETAGAGGGFWRSPWTFAGLVGCALILASLVGYVRRRMS
jgi:hypothetical protein